MMRIGARRAAFASGISIPHGVDRFIHEALITQTNHSVVYGGVDTYTGARVVLKSGARHPRHDRDACAMLTNEIGLLPRLAAVGSSRHIRYFGHFRDRAGEPVLVMEHLAGETLADMLERGKTVPVKTAVALFLDFLQGVADIHQCGIVHRDLGPHNLFMTAEGRGKIIDFGAAYDLTGVLENPEPPAYAVASEYRAPEDHPGFGKPHFPTDIYTLGVSLYDAMVGELPPLIKPLCIFGFLYSGAYFGPHLFRHRPAAAAGVSPRALKSLDAIIQRATRKAPGDRYPTADAFAADLRAWQQEFDP